MMGVTAGHRRNWTRRFSSVHARAHRTGIVLAVAATALIASQSESRAESAGTEPELAFDIPSLPLESALAAFGAKTGFQVLYETALTAGRRSQEVKGRYTPDTALRRLLSGTGLNVDYIEDHAFTLMEASLQATRSAMEFREYLGVVQASLMAALCQRAETQPGAYNVAMQFSIGQTGRINNPRLLNSTGAETRDDALIAALSRLTVDRTPPPADMPQPVTMLLKSDERGARECRETRR
jgi:hypothetical protein